MIRTFIIAALLATGSLHGAIKKAQGSKSETIPEAKPQKSPAPQEKGAAELLEELRGRAERDGGMLGMNIKDLISRLRSVLEKQGIPPDELDKAGLPELLRLLKEKNPETFKDFGFGGTPGFDKATEKKLADHYGQLLEGHKPGTLMAATATFILRDAKNPADPIAFATGVRGDGWLLTKASEVGSAAELQCQIKGAWVAARIVRTWPEHDLALVKAEAMDFPAVKLSKRTELQVGTFIAAVAPDGREPVAIGIVSVPVRNEQTKGRGFLGVQVKSDERGLKIDKLVPGGPAKASGLREEDRILEIDGKKPDSVFTFTKLVSDRKAGDKVRLKFQRGESIVEKEIALADRGAMVGSARSGNEKMNSMGSTISKRRTDFPAVIQTDLPLQATQCGGPVTDLDGNVVGLVIARSGRVETMVLPSETIQQLLASVDFSKEAEPAAPKKKKKEAPKPEASEPAEAK